MSEQQHLDPATLEMLKDMLGQGFDGLIDTFLEDSRVKVEGLRSHLAAGDAEELRRAAHSLKGSTANVGAHRLCEFCLDVEQRAREERLDGLELLLDELESEYRAVEALMLEDRGA